MKKQLFKSIMLSLALSIMPMSPTYTVIPSLLNNTITSLSAYPITKWTLSSDNNQKKQITASDIKATAPGIIAATCASGILSQVVHEYGHALTGSILNPGSLKSIYPLRGAVHWKEKAYWNKSNFISMCAAGPLAGLGFCYAGLKGLQIYDAYQKNHDLQASINEAKEKPILSTPDSTLTSAAQIGLLNATYHQCLSFFVLPQGGARLKIGPLTATLPSISTDINQILNALWHNHATISIPKWASRTWNGAALCAIASIASQAKESTQEPSN